MRQFKIITAFLMGVSVLFSCSIDDEPANQNPEKVELTNPSDQTQGVEIEDLDLQWQLATDPDGNNVSYDVFLDGISPPAGIVATDLNTTIHNIQGPLDYNKTYYWSITAKDGNGGTSHSEVSMFTTWKANPDELILGKWFLNEMIVNGTSETLTDCNKTSYFEFDTNGKLNVVFFDEDPFIITTSTITNYGVPKCDNSYYRYGKHPHCLPDQNRVENNFRRRTI
jgi:hypothetical protein